MDKNIKGIADYLVREALYGWYNQRNIYDGDHDVAVIKVYNTLLHCVRNDYGDTAMAKELTKAALMSFWGRPLSTMDISGERYKRAAYEVYKALTDVIKKTVAY